MKREREREREREKEREEGDGWDYLYRMEKCWVLNRVADHTESAIKDWVMTEINNMAHSIIRNKWKHEILIIMKNKEGEKRRI